MERVPGTAEPPSPISQQSSSSNFVSVTTDCGAGKPLPAIFNHALAALDAEPVSSAYVGDSLHWDIGGANQVGILSIWLNRSGAQRRVGESSTAGRNRLSPRASRVAQPDRRMNISRPAKDPQHPLQFHGAGDRRATLKAPPPRDGVRSGCTAHSRSAVSGIPTSPRPSGPADWPPAGASASEWVAQRPSDGLRASAGVPWVPPKSPGPGCIGLNCVASSCPGYSVNYPRSPAEPALCD